VRCQVRPNTGIFKRGMSILKSFIDVTFERLALESSHLSRHRPLLHLRLTYSLLHPKAIAGAGMSIAIMPLFDSLAWSAS